MLSSRFLLVALVATATATLAATPARADARVKVPFSFTVDGKRCPAGTYLVKEDANTDTVILVGRDPSRIFSWIIAPDSIEVDPNRVVLQFDRAGSDHALRSIKYGSQGTLRLDTHVPKSAESEDNSSGGR
ncbi:MAG: hypothetical protein WCC26_04140 [Terracidiphilus sp.]